MMPSSPSIGDTSPMKKFIKRGLLVILVVLIIGGVILYLTVNTIIADEIESATTDALGVKTTVGSFDLSLLQGRSSISDLEIANPPSYDGDFLKLGTGVIGVNLGSIWSDRIEIEEITLKDIDVSLIERLDGSNLGVIISNAEKGDDDDASQSSKNDSDDSSDDQKFIIDKVEADNIRITIAIEPITTNSKPTVLEIGQILVKDIGKKQNGVTLDQVTSILVRSIIGSAAKAAPGQIPSVLLTTMEGGLSSLTHLDVGDVHLDLGEGISKAVHGIGDAAKSGADAAGKAINNIGKGIGDLFDSDKGKGNSSEK